ncbi:copper resistance CopC family protein [Zavarzinia sp. CC-PAN008]|uniref:copper resistance CopC family protein n=1 Tax=Zavarzinia sp. CC-PAN008 TaxID=3243332 RepID=UPI003F748DF7
MRRLVRGPAQGIALTLIAALLVLGLGVAARPGPALAHALVLEASPGVNARVNGPDVPIRVEFNSRIDKARSRIVLFLPDGSQRDLALVEEANDHRLVSTATGLQPGKHRLRWFVLAIDGHLTRGDIPFEIVAP